MLDFWKKIKQELQILDSGPAAIWVELITASVCKCFTCGWRVTHNPDRKTEEGQQPMESAVRMMFCNSGKNALLLILFHIFLLCQECLYVFCSDNLRWNQTWFTLICCIAISRMLLLTWGTRLVTGQSSPPKPQTTSHNPLPHHQAVVIPPSPVFWVWQMCLYMREPCSFPLHVFRLIFPIPSFIRHVCATSHGPLCFAS